jgi:hypothetical protein
MSMPRPLTILDVGTGLGEFFNKFYHGTEMDQILQEAGIAVVSGAACHGRP